MAGYAEERCPILYALDIVGQKWKLPILWCLHEAKATRYLELKRRMPGITNTMRRARFFREHMDTRRTMYGNSFK